MTTAGVSAGIDGSLHVVARLLGQRVADQSARNMEYRWAPEPYLTAGYQWLNPSLDDRGRLLQQADIAAEERRWPEAERVYREVAQKDPGRPDAWLHLGGMYMANKDYGQAAEAYRRAVAAGHKSGPALYNLACAYARTRDSKRALDTLAEAVRAEMQDRGHMAHDPDLESLHGDPRFQQLISAR